MAEWLKLVWSVVEGRPEELFTEGHDPSSAAGKPHRIGEDWSYGGGWKGDERRVEVYCRPAMGCYREMAALGREASLECASVPGLRFHISELFPG
jgi:hypothetical protein